MGPLVKVTPVLLASLLLVATAQDCDVKLNLTTFSSPPIFSGNSPVDFGQLPNSASLLDPFDLIIVGQPSVSSGWEVSHVHFYYSTAEDIAYFGIDCAVKPGNSGSGICGDADGDGDPGNPARTDPPNLSAAEEFVMLLDTNNDGTFEVAVGIPVLDDIQQFKTYKFPGFGVSSSPSTFLFDEETCCPTKLFDYNPNVHVGTQFGPNELQPDLEFSVENFSNLTGFSFKPTDPALDFRFGLQILFGGGSGDEVINEEQIEGTFCVTNVVSTTATSTPTTTATTTPSSTPSSTFTTSITTTVTSTATTTLSSTISTTPTTTSTTSPSTTPTTTATSTLSTSASTTLSTTRSTTPSSTPTSTKSTSASSSPTSSITTTQTTTKTTTHTSTVSTTLSTTASTTQSTTPTTTVDTTTITTTATTTEAGCTTLVVAGLSQIEGLYTVSTTLIGDRPTYIANVGGNLMYLQWIDILTQWWIGPTPDALVGFANGGNGDPYVWPEDISVWSVFNPSSGLFEEEPNFTVTCYDPSATTTTTVVTTTTTPRCPNGARSYDFFFVVDGSGSITTQNFALVKDFLQDITTDITNSYDDWRVGIMEYSTNTQSVIAFTDDIQAIHNAIAATTQSAGDTGTATALADANRAIINTRRFDADPVLILLTDGRNAEAAESLSLAVTALSLNGIERYSVGIGPIPDQSELELIASSANQVFLVPGFDSLTSFPAQILAAMEPCVLPPTTSATTTPTTSVTTTATTTATTTPTTTVTTTTIEPCPSGISFTWDIFFLVDGSGSISDVNFDLVRQFLQNTVNVLATDYFQWRVGLAEYSTNYAPVLNFTDNVQQIQFHITNLVHSKGDTKTATALKRSNGQISSHERNGATSVLVLLTDGRNAELPQDLLDAVGGLDSASIERIAIGVGSSVDNQELSTIAGGNDRVVDIETFGDLDAATSRVIDLIPRCDRPGTTQSTTATSSITSQATTSVSSSMSTTPTSSATSTVTSTVSTSATTTATTTKTTTPSSTPSSSPSTTQTTTAASTGSSSASTTGTTTPSTTGTTTATSTGTTTPPTTLSTLGSTTATTTATTTVATSQPTTATTTATSTPCLTEPPKVDFFFVIDGSGSIAPADFEKMRVFIRDYIDSINRDFQDWRVGLSEFSSRFRLIQAFSSSLRTVQASLASLVPAGKSTAMSTALESAGVIMSAEGRSEASQVMIVLTDGENRETTETLVAAVDGLDTLLIERIAIGIGEEPDDEELLLITGDASRVLRGTFDELEAILPQVLEIGNLPLCPGVTLETTGTTTASTTPSSSPTSTASTSASTTMTTTPSSTPSSSGTTSASTTGTSTETTSPTTTPTTSETTTMTTSITTTGTTSETSSESTSFTTTGTTSETTSETTSPTTTVASTETTSATTTPTTTPETTATSSPTTTETTSENTSETSTVSTTFTTSETTTESTSATSTETTSETTTRTSSASTSETSTESTTASSSPTSTETTSESSTQTTTETTTESTSATTTSTTTPSTSETTSETTTVSTSETTTATTTETTTATSSETTTETTSVSTTVTSSETTTETTTGSTTKTTTETTSKTTSGTTSITSTPTTSKTTTPSTTETTTPSSSATTTPSTSPTTTGTTTTLPRTCRPFGDECHTCNTEFTACIKCKNSFLLHEGKCVADCPSGFEARGSGTFNRKCIVATSALSCTANKDDCDQCLNERECKVCKNAKYLLDGRCITEAECPTNYFLRGSGSFNRLCVAPPAPSCTDNKNFCHTCNAEKTACTKCKNARYLHEGECLDSCPATHTPTGQGNFNRKCVLKVVLCKVNKDNCHTCNSDETACLRCKNAKYLFEGTCIDSCPSSTEAKGTGSFNRKCV